MIANAYQQYVKQSLSTLSPVQTVIALYGKAEQELQKAIYFIDNNNLEKASESIIKVQDIVAALDSALKMGYAVSDNLASMYDYFTQQLIQANLHKDKKILASLIPFFKDLKDAFTQISRKE